MKEKISLLLRYIYYRLFFKFYYLGWPVGFGGKITLRNSHRISVGNGVYLADNVVIQVADEYENFQSTMPQLKLGKRVRVNYFTMISAVKSVDIGDNVNIAQFCFIGDHNHEYRDITRPIRDQGIADVRPVVIKKNTWIANKVTVTSGVTIGRNCVIGANSVVTKDIPDYSVAVGVPARVISQYNNETKKWEQVKS